MLNVTRFRVFTILLIFLILGWFLFTYRILEVPPGINGDEASIGYNAALIAKNGRDSSGEFLPLFTAVKGSNDWKQPMTIYATVLAFRLFGSSYFMLRAVSVLFVLLSAVLIFFLIYEFIDLKTAIWGLVIFAATPIVMIQSHLALENIAPVPFIAFWLWMIVKYCKHLKLKYLILAGVSLGISIFSYLGLRLIAPPLVITTAIFIYYLGRKTPKVAIRRILIFLLVVVPFWVILLMSKYQYPGSILGQYRPSKLLSYQQLLLPYLSSFDPSFLFIKGDATPYHSTGKHGMFLLASLPLFILGLGRIIRSKQPVLIFILSNFFLTPVLYGWASDVYRASRLMSLTPFYVVIASLGMGVVFSIRKKLWRLFVVVTILTLIFLNFMDFLGNYWFDYPNRVKAEFSKPYHLVFQRAHQLTKEDNLTAFIQNDFRTQNPIAIDFFETMYFPNGLRLWRDNQPIPENSLIIVSDYILKKKEIAQEKVGEGEFGILMNSNK